MKLPNKYALYEAAVQSPEAHVELFLSFFKDVYGGQPKHLREDFCGTFGISCEWIKKSSSNTAMSIDLDGNPLKYGIDVHRKKLTPEQRKRLKIHQRNVLNAPLQKVDLIAACNFSFFILKERATLLSYFKKCLSSLSSSGLLVLEVAGGPGMIAKMKETKTIKRNGKPYFRYCWDQKSFNPISRNGRYSIHFTMLDSNGQKKAEPLKDVFTYDWRLWTLPEIRDILAEAGFQKTYIYWETEHRGKGTGEYARTETGDNAYAWVAYIAAGRSTTRKKN